jgi:hypothetical protein
MGRNKLAQNAHLPSNLYIKADGYYWYRDPIEKRTIGLGRDGKYAIRYAKKRNADQDKSVLTVRGKRVSVAERNISVDPNGLVDLPFLRANAEPYARVCGIYFLMFDGEVVYVGQSTSCHGRISTHVLEGKKQFDACYIVRTDATSLTALEALYIKKFEPRYNLATLSVSRNTAWGLVQDLSILSEKAA